MSTSITRAMERAYNYAIEATAHQPLAQAAVRADWNHLILNDVSELRIVLLFSRIPVRMVALSIVDKAGTEIRSGNAVSVDLGELEEAVEESLRSA